MATLDDLKLARDGHLGYGKPRKWKSAMRPVGEVIRTERDDARGIARSFVRVGDGVVEYERELDFVGRSPCGCVTAWASSSITGRDRQRTLDEFRRDGQTIERMTTDEARAVLQIDCPHRSLTPEHDR